MDKKLKIQQRIIFQSLLKASPLDRHTKAYTTRIYTMQYAYHICNGIDPTVISIRLFWVFHYHMSHKDLRLWVLGRLISVIDVDITSMNPYQPLPFYILYFANIFHPRILIYAGSNIS